MSVSGSVWGNRCTSHSVSHINGLPSQKFHKHLERVGPLMALPMRGGCGAKHRTSGAVPTDFGAEVNGASRHEVGPAGDLTVVSGVPMSEPSISSNHFDVRRRGGLLEEGGRVRDPLTGTARNRSGARQAGC